MKSKNMLLFWFTSSESKPRWFIGTHSYRRVQNNFNNQYNFLGLKLKLNWNTFAHVSNIGKNGMNWVALVLMVFSIFWWIFMLSFWFSFSFFFPWIICAAYMKFVFELPFMLKLQLFIFLLKWMPKHLFLQLLLLLQLQWIKKEKLMNNLFAIGFHSWLISIDRFHAIDSGMATVIVIEMEGEVNQIEREADVILKNILLTWIV